MQLNLNKLMALISGIACSMSLAFAEPVGETLIENIRVIDGKGNAPVEAQDVLLADGKILRVADHGKIETAALLWSLSLLKPQTLNSPSFQSTVAA